MYEFYILLYLEYGDKLYLLLSCNVRANVKLKVPGRFNTKLCYGVLCGKYDYSNKFKSD